MPLAALLAPQLAKKADEIEAALGPAYLPKQNTGLDIGPVRMAPDEPAAPGAGLDIGPVRMSSGGLDVGPVRPTPGLDIGPVRMAPPEPAPALAPQGYLRVGQPTAEASGIDYQKWLATHGGGPKTALDPRGLIQPNTLPGYDVRAQGGKIMHDIGELQRAGQPEMANALLAGLGREAHNPGYLPRDHGSETLIPNAPIAPIAPIAPNSRYFIPLPAGAAGFNELGQAVDIKGKNLGYLSQPADDHLPHLPPEPSDWSQPALEATFGQHLQAQQENRDENGMPTDQFPPGYFTGMSKEKIASIKAGVKELVARAKGTKI